jgi:hypothetical protein
LKEIFDSNVVDELKKEKMRFLSYEDYRKIGCYEHLNSSQNILNI